MELGTFFPASLCHSTNYCRFPQHALSGCTFCCREGGFVLHCHHNGKVLLLQLTIYSEALKVFLTDANVTGWHFQELFVFCRTRVYFPQCWSRAGSWKWPVLFQNQRCLYQKLMLIVHEQVGDSRLLNMLRQRNQQSRHKAHEKMLNCVFHNGDSGNHIMINFMMMVFRNKIFLFAVNRVCIILMKRLGSEWAMRWTADAEKTAY
jgi:hypothetical protein